METPLPIDDVERRALTRVLRVALLVAAFTGLSFVATAVVSSLTAAPASALLRGVDVSSWQHPGTGNSCGRGIDWVQVRSSGVSFAYAKSTQATTYTNPCFAQDWAGIAAAGLLRGSYHYAKPALPISTAVDQARYFVSQAGSMTGPGDLPGMLDLEETGGLGPTDLSNWTRAFLNEVTLLTGKKPVLYMGAYFFPGTIAPDISSTYQLWIPSYPCQDYGGNRICDPYTYGSQPRLPAGWSTWTWWQFSSIEQVPGIYANSTGGVLDNVDMSFFCCDAGSLQALTGSGAGGGSPFGAFDGVAATATTASVSGWAIDPDSVDPIAIHAYVDGRLTAAFLANGSRADVAAVYPGFGPNHGFGATFAIPTGARQVCLFGINVGPGWNPQLGCRSIGGDPVGNLDVVALARPGRIAVTGWAFDPNDTARNIPVHVYVGPVGTAITANQWRPDVGSAYGITNDHGFGVEVPAPGGAQQVCVYAINDVGPGSNVLLACRTVVVPTGSPFGSLDVASGRAGAIDIAGWAIDPDTVDAVAVHLYVDGALTPIAANGWRPDLAAAYPGYGGAHGFATSIAMGAGSHQLCAYAINIAGSGSNVLLGCRTAQVPSSDPFGSIDAAWGGYASVNVAGWEIDPDTSAPSQVHIYVDGVGYAVTADLWRPDVAAVFPASGPSHGYSFSLPVAGGSHQVCVYAINTAGPGSNRGIACRTVVAIDPSPFGSIDGSARAYGRVQISGWAIDPDTTDPITIHVYVNGVVTGFVASDFRPDLVAPFGRGAAHGFNVVLLQQGTGPQNVCVFGIDVGAGSNSLIGCRTL